MRSGGCNASSVWPYEHLTMRYAILAKTRGLRLTAYWVRVGPDSIMPDSVFTFTLDLEDNRPDGCLPCRFDLMSKRVLEFFIVQQIEASRFVVGGAARQTLALICEFTDDGYHIVATFWTMLPSLSRVHSNYGTRRTCLRTYGASHARIWAPMFSLTADIA